MSFGLYVHNYCSGFTQDSPTDVRDELLECILPAVHLDHSDPRDHLVHDLHSLVSVPGTLKPETAGKQSEGLAPCFSDLPWGSPHPTPPHPPELSIQPAHEVLQRHLQEEQPHSRQTAGPKAHVEPQ